MTINNKAYLKTWVKISKKNLLNNLRVFKNLAKKQQFMAVVKSNAYGHGMLKIAKFLDNQVDYFGVDSVQEGVKLRQSKIKSPILILGAIIPSQINLAIKNNLDISVSSFDQFKFLLSQKRKTTLKIHIKVDTGMGRQGFLWKDNNKLIEILNKLPKQIKLIGLYSHLASGDTKKGEKQTKSQIKEFKKWITLFCENNFVVTTHLFATSGLLNYQDNQFDMVRIGIGLYGIWPSNYLRNKLSKRIKLQPVLSWQTILTEIKILEKGSCIGYGCTEKLSKNSKIGICPIGYWHGFPRLLSNKACVLVNNQKARVLGAVSMDMIALDLSQVKKPKVLDEVLLFGGNKNETTNLNNLENKFGVSAYELVTRINPLIPRL